MDCSIARRGPGARPVGVVVLGLAGGTCALLLLGRAVMAGLAGGDLFVQTAEEREGLDAPCFLPAE